MTIFKAYKVYVSKTYRICMNIFAAALVFLSFMLSDVEFFPYGLMPMGYVAVACVVDFFQFGGILSKKGNLPNYIKSSFVGREVVVKAVAGDLFAHFVRIFLFTIAGTTAADCIRGVFTPMWLMMGVCACFSSIMMIAIILFVVRMLSVSFQVAMLIVYLFMFIAGAPLMASIIIHMLIGDNCTVPLMITSILEIAVITVFSTLIVSRSVKAYRFKLSDTE